MTGEIVTGAVQGVAQAATEAVKTPVTVVASVGAAASSIASVGNAVSEIAPVVGQGIETITKTAGIVGNTAPLVDMPSFIGKAGELASQGSEHEALTLLAFGDIPADSTLGAAAGEVPLAVLNQDFVALENMGPQAVLGLTNDLEALGLPQHLIDDPAFLQLFSEEMMQNVLQKKDLLTKGVLTGKDYMAHRQDMLRQSADRAARKTKEKSPTKIQDKDLEELKRQAAFEAIKKHMFLWRKSVMGDRRLTDEAKQRALRKIDLLEKKLLLKESIKWDGMSLMKLVALASLWVQEALMN